MSSFVKASGGITPNSADPGEEFPFLHTITVVDRVVSVDKPELVQNNIKTETITLNLDSEWEGLSTVINIGNEKPVSVIWSGEPVVIPAELMTTIGSLDVSVVGYGDDGGIRAVTKKATSIFNVVASGFVEGDEAVPDPTTLLGQLIQAADNANQASEDIESIGPAIEKVQASEAINADTVANMQNTNALSTQLAQCCCENRQGQAQIQYDMATNTCAIQNAIQNQTQQIIQNDNANYRQLHDEIVANRMEDLKSKIADQAQEINQLNLSASQCQQNAYLISQLRPNPVRHSRLQIRLLPCIPVAATITSLSDSTSGGIL